MLVPSILYRVFNLLCIQLRFLQFEVVHYVNEIDIISGRKIAKNPKYHKVYCTVNFRYIFDKEHKNHTSQLTSNSAVCQLQF